MMIENDLIFHFNFDKFIHVPTIRYFLTVNAKEWNTKRMDELEI